MTVSYLNMVLIHLYGYLTAAINSRVKLLKFESGFHLGVV